MKMFRLGFSILALVGVVAVIAPLADEGEYEDAAKCDCWYWQSNQNGIIKTTTENGKPVEKCETVTCTPKVE